MVTKPLFARSLIAAAALACSTTAFAAVTYLTIPTVLYGANLPQYPDNCVLFLRYDMKIALPRINLTTWTAKKSIVNVSGSPRSGDVAIIRIPRGTSATDGQVAQVRSVTSTSITVLEANYRAGKVTMRQATGTNLADAAAQLNIYGYFRP